MLRLPLSFPLHSMGVSPIKDAIIRLGRNIRDPLTGIRFSPLSLFSSGEQGVWYEPSLTDGTLFTDAAGTTPVTAVEQPVGLMLDKSKGLVLGPELVPSTIPSISGAGWTTNGTSITATSSTTSGTIALTASTPSTRFYQVTFTASGLSGATSYMVFSSGVSALTKRINTAKTYSFIVPGQGTVAFEIAPYEGTAFSVTISNISVRELPGNHAFQTSAASRPVLSARVNLLEKTQEFDNAYWTKDAVTTPSANELLETAATALHGVRRVGVATLTAGVNYVLSARVKANGRNFALLYTNQGNSGKYFDITPGTSGAVLGNYSATSVSGAIQALGNGEFLCSITVPFASGGLSAEIYVSDTGSRASYAGDSTKGLFVYSVDLRVANDGVGLPPYQRVNTATDYDTTNFPLYLRFDGVDDSLQTNSINFTSTDKMTVWAGVRRLSDAIQIFAELSTNFNNFDGGFILNIDLGSSISFATRGLSASVYAAGGFIDAAAPLTEVIALYCDRGLSTDDVVFINKNGVSQTLTRLRNDNPTGNYGNYPLFIGRRNNATLPFNGRLYSLLIRGAQSTTAQIEATENYVNARTKAWS